jgi:tetratricopeptide (TPR) repeat protein
VQLAQRAVEIDDSLPQAHWVLGYVYLYVRKQHELAIAEGKKTIELDPNDADGYAVQAVSYLYSGRLDEAIRLIRKAMRLNPHYPSQYPTLLGLAHYFAGRHDEAVVAFQEAIEQNYSRLPPHVNLAATYASLGQQQEADWEADNILTLSPDFALEEWKKAQPFSDPSLLQRMIDDLRKAGLPG